MPAADMAPLLCGVANADDAVIWEQRQRIVVAVTKRLERKFSRSMKIDILILP